MRVVGLIKKNSTKAEPKAKEDKKSTKAEEKAEKEVKTPEVDASEKPDEGAEPEDGKVQE